MSTKKTKRLKQRSEEEHSAGVVVVAVDEIELAEVAWRTYFNIQPKDVCSWQAYHDGYKENWRAVARAVLDEILNCVNAKLNAK